MSAKKICFIAMFTALGTVLSLIAIPSPAGYLNFGDAVNFLALLFLGIYAIPVAGIGGLFADLLTGYPVFAPFTLVVKTAMSLTAYLFVRKSFAEPKFYKFFLAFLCGGTVMVSGYFLTNLLLFRSVTTALASLVFDCVQALSCSFVASLCSLFFLRRKTQFPIFKEQL